MENATLFCVGTVRGIRTAAIGTSDGCEVIEGDYDPHGNKVKEGKINMLRTGLNVAAKLTYETSQNEEATNKKLMHYCS